MDQKDDSDELQLSLSESFNSVHVSEELPGKDNGKMHHILKNVEEWKNRRDAKEKAEAVEKIQQFKIKAMALEKEKASQLYGKKNEFRKDFCDLEEHELKLTAERKRERESIQNKIQRISSNVKKFQKEIEEPQSTHEFLEKLKILMEEIESSILKYKQQQGALYDEMMKEEKQLNADLESFEAKMESWITSSSKLSSHTKTKQKDEQKTVSIPPEVTAFQRYLSQTGGHQGGWDEYDHQTFLKLKKKHKAFEDFIENAESEIPTRSRDDIIQHDEWYREYLTLREHKRIAIAKWKDLKESEKQEKLQKIENDAENERLRELKRREIIEKEKMERFAQLEKWKLEKELQRQKKAEMKEKQRVDNKLRTEEEEQKREETKARVLEYQTRKKEEAAILELSRKAREEEERRAKKLSSEEQSRIKERDEKILENKRRRLEQKEREKIEKEKRLSKLRNQVEVQVERDPSRLYQLTEGWKARNRSVRSEKSQPQLQFQRRAVPNWRQGMS